MNVVAISAAVSAVVTVVVGTMVNWGERIVGWLRHKLVPDHLAIGSGTVSVSSVATSSDASVRILVSVAPSRSRRRQEVLPDHAIELVNSRFPGFPSDPVFSMPGEGVRFESIGSTDHNSVWVRASGRVDLRVALPTSAAELGPISISINDVVRPILDMTEAVRSAEYAQAFGRRTRRRVDWAIAVSQTAVVKDRGSQSWSQLRFPGQEPARSGTAQQAYCPSDGYASKGLRGWRVGRSDSALLRVFLRDFLYQNGYHNVDDAIDAVIASVTSPVN